MSNTYYSELLLTKNLVSFKHNLQKPIWLLSLPCELKADSKTHNRSTSQKGSLMSGSPGKQPSTHWAQQEATIKKTMQPWKGGFALIIYALRTRNLCFSQKYQFLELTCHEISSPEGQKVSGLNERWCEYGCDSASTVGTKISLVHSSCLRQAQLQGPMDGKGVSLGLHKNSKRQTFLPLSKKLK